MVSRLSPLRISSSEERFGSERVRGRGITHARISHASGGGKKKRKKRARRDEHLIIRIEPRLDRGWISIHGHSEF